MIDKNEIITLAKALSLRPDTIEKDYVLSWILWGIYNDADLAPKWVFKGGTSLKKCFFETFRFSEDLDFTIIDHTHLSTEFLHEKFNAITSIIHDQVGIEFSNALFKFDIIEKTTGKLSIQGKIHYRGPIGSSRRFNSIKLDLTNDEIIVLNTKKMEVYHPYSDMPKNSIFANCYAFEEVIAEKIRALGQRARPRDLYDVIHFFRNKEMIENPLLVYDTLVKKCDYKQINVPTYKSIEQHEKLEELHEQYVHMLAHQLPTLPPIESFWKDLKPFFNWIENNFQEKHPIS
jgi:predicted nucleotidyltransferase component of viral defense system